MTKSRNSRAEKEYSREQKLAHENRELRRALAKLRKQLEHIDLDRYQEIKEIVEQSYAAENEADNSSMVSDLKHQWTCPDCNAGVMEICLYNKMSETWFFRECNGCSKRTKSERYEAGVTSGVHRPPMECKK